MTHHIHEGAFHIFDEENPHIYARLVSMSQQAHDNGVRRLGMGMMIEVLRWDHMTGSRSRDRFKINDTHEPHYARKIAREFPHLAGLFEFRRLRAVA
jgi:hypothetical protein